MATLDDFLANANAVLGAEKQALGAGYGAIGAANENARAAINASADAQITLNQTEADAVAKQQAAKQQIATELGVTSGDAQRAILSKQILEAKDQVVRAHAEMSAITEQRFTDNPLGWIVNQFRQPFVEEQVKEADQRFKDMSGIYATLDSTAQNGFQTVQQLNQADAAAKFAAQSKVVFAQRDAQAAQLDHQNALSGINAAKDMASIDLAKNAQAQSMEKWKEERANHAQAMKVQQAHLALAQDAAADRNKIRAAQAEKEMILKQGLASFYPPEQRANILKYSSGQLEAALEANPAVANQAYAMGLKVAAAGTGSPSIISYGQSVGEAANVMDMTHIPANAQWLMDIRKKFAMATPEEQARLYGVKGTDIIYQKEMGANGKPVATSPLFDAAVEKELIAKAKNIDPRDKSNPFLAPSLSQLVTTDPQVARLGVVKNYLGNLGPGAEESLQNPKAIILGVMAAQPNADINMLAQEVSTLYSRVRANTNAMNNFIGAGVSPKVLEAGYTVDGVDYSKPAEVAKAAMKFNLQSKGIIAGGKLGDLQFRISNALVGAPKQ